MDYQTLNKQNSELFNNTNAIIKIITDIDIIHDWQNQKRNELVKNKLPLSWADIGIILEDPYILVIRDLVEFPDGKKNGYIRLVNNATLNNAKGVVILPQIENKIVLLHQFRHSTRSWHFEIPRGFGESGLSPKQNAEKEILEEICGKIHNLTDIGIMHSNTGLEVNVVQIYFAVLDSLGKTNISEGIDGYQLVTTDEFELMISKGDITDAFTITAYARAKLRGLI